MEIKHKDPLIVAFIVAGITTLCWGIIGTNDLEEQFNGAYSYAASFKSGIFSRAPEFGKHTALGVPVYDTSVGLGYRLPFLYGTSHSPFVFLRYIFTTEAIQFFVVFVSSFIAMASLNFMYKSWNTGGSRRYGLTMMLLLDLVVFGPPTIYLFLNDWSTQAAQYFGALAITSSLFEKTWFCNGAVKPLGSTRVQFTLTIGSILMFMGHQGNIPNFLALIAIPLIFHVYSKRITFQDYKQAFFLFGVVVVNGMPNILDLSFESAKQPFERITAINWYSFNVSTRGILIFIKQLVRSNSWPIDSINSFRFPDFVAESSKGYFGLALIILSICGFVFIKKSKPLIIAYLLLTSCLVLVCLQSAFQQRLGILASSAAWQLRDTLLIISTIFIALFSAALGDSRSTKLLSLTILRTITALAVCFSALFPLSVMGIQGRNSGYDNGIISEAIRYKDNSWIEKLRGAGVKVGDRIYIANPDLFRFASWSGYEKLPQFVDINVSTINGWPKMRSAFTLAKNQAGFEAKFYNVIDSRFGCRPYELDFLAVDWVIDSNGECYKDFLLEFGEKDVTIISMGRNGRANDSKSVFLYKLNQRKIYTANNDNLSGSNKPCALLVEDNCLNKLGIGAELIGEKYFNLCIQSCIAELLWYSREPNSQIVVPIDYQPFLKIVDTRTNRELEASSHNGLLKIDPGKNTRYGDTIKILLEPDALMLARALAAWFSTSALLFMCAMFWYKKSSIQ
jgi:hypothetical protein